MNAIDRTVTRVYTLLLCAFPPAHRSEYAREMVDAFARDFDARRLKDGRVPALRFAVAACLNVVSAGLGERRRRRLAGGKGSGVPMATAGRDLAHAARALAKARAFTVVCALSLGVGIGVVMALFVFMRAVFGPPAGVDPDGLVELIVRTEGELRARQGGWDMDTWSYPDFVDLRDAGPGMSLTAWTVGRSIWSEPGTSGPTRLSTMYVSPNYFTTIGAGLIRGAGFEGMASGGAAEPIAVVGYYLWQNRLGADPNVIGRTITLNRVEHVIAGVAPRRFQSHVSPEDGPGIDVWMPLEQHPRLRLQAADSLRFDRGADWLRVLGRLEPTTTLAQADAAVASVMSGLAARYPASNQFKSGGVEPYFSMGALARGEVRMAQALMVGLAGLVLTIVCLNLSGMMVVRSATRERELAVRLALGASRRRLMQYLLSESLVLALVGGALASAVLFGGPALLIWWFGVGPSADLELLKPDRWIVLYGLGVCFVTTLVFGLVPAIRFSRPTLVSALKDEAGSGGGRRVGRVHRWTAAVQAGIAVPFLVIGGVKLDQVRTTATADLGFETTGLFAMPLDLATVGQTGEEGASYVRRVQEQVGQASGVRSVTVANGLPLDFRYRIVRVSREGQAAVLAAHTTRVGDGYFDTMGIPIVRGRGISRDDREGAEPVVVLSEPLARQLFPDGNALGSRLSFAIDENRTRLFTVVGITADLVTSQMGTARPQMFVPLAQHPVSAVVLIARTTAPNEAMIAAFQNAVPDLEPGLVRSSHVTGEWLVRRSMSDLLTHSTMASIAALIMLTLAALGVYGVVGFMVATRTREIGVRMALGASRPRVLGTILADAMKLVVPGVAVGLVLSVFYVRYWDPSLYPLGGVEPLAYSVAALIALTVAAVAGLPSARRAARVEPVIAMRAE